MMDLTINNQCTPEQFDAYCERLDEAGTNYRFAIGDAYNFAKEKKWDKRDAFETLLKNTEYSPRTIYEFARVARLIPSEKRRSGLDFGHHAAISTLPVAEQEVLLLRAENEGMTVSELHSIVKPKKSKSWFNQRGELDEESAMAVIKWCNDTQDTSRFRHVALDGRDFGQIFREFVELKEKYDNIIEGAEKDMDEYLYFVWRNEGFAKVAWEDDPDGVTKIMTANVGTLLKRGAWYNVGLYGASIIMQSVIKDADHRYK